MKPVLYSFRRCPYAIRARLAVASSGVEVALREILLRDKPEPFLAASPSATVPCLVTDGGVIDESLDVMLWALKQADPEKLMEMPDAGHALVQAFDGPFKTALDHTKYAVRHPELDADVERGKAMEILSMLRENLAAREFLYGDGPSLADFAILPFVRQFANVDKARFDAEISPEVGRWLEAFLASERLAYVMRKLPPWKPDDPELVFPFK